MAMATCPTNAIPEDQNLNIDSDSVFAVVPRGNTTDSDDPDAWMVGCCEPSPVQLAGDGLTGTCWQWCDLPASYTNWTSDSSKMMNQFTNCITYSASYKNSTVQPNIFHVSAAPRAAVVGDGIVGLAAVLVVTAWRVLM